MTSDFGVTPQPPASLTVEPDRFSDDAWELLLSAQDGARRWRHGDLDVEHLLQALFSDPRFEADVGALPLPQDQLLDQLESFLEEQPMARGDELYVGEDLETLLEAADRVRGLWGSRLIEVSHLLIAIGRDPRIGADLLSRFGLPADRLEAELRRPTASAASASPSPPAPVIRSAAPTAAVPIVQPITEPVQSGLGSSESVADPVPDPAKEPEPRALDRYARDLTAAAAQGLLDPVVGRDGEIRSLIKVLSRRGKNNPVLIGAPGVGKTAIAELLAQRIVAGEVPESLQGLRLVAMDVGALIAGAKFRGQFEERLREVLQEVSDPEAGVVLFIDELHTVVNSDRSSADAGSLLKPALARGDLRCIAATTPEDYRRTVEKDPALNRRFQQVQISEPSIDHSVEILRGVKERYELHHGVTITDAAVTAAARLADRYISDRCLPDKAIDLIDEAAAQLKMDVTSKPQVVEDAEMDLRRVELAVLAAEQAPESERVQLQRQRLEASSQLTQLRERWQAEREQLQELRQLLQEDEDLRHAIAEAERQGDLEEAARLQYDQLHRLQQRRSDLEEALNKAQRDGTALLREQVEAEDIADVVARWTGIPIQRLLAGERQKLLELDQRLADRVIGQSDAVAAVAAAIRRARAGMKDPRRPVGSFLFLGPTGVGKTELAKALAGQLFDEEESMVRLDMSEFMERNAVARLLGAPPGYVGYEEGGQLTEAVRRRPYALLLLDEVEKAHPDVFNVLLQVLDDGRLSDSQGRTVDFRHTVVVMTSNLASRAILESARQDVEAGTTIDQSALNAAVDEALGHHFRPEFLNRIDEVIRFQPLGLDDLSKIVRLQLADLAALLREQGLELRVEEGVIEAIVSLGYEPEYGARPLRRVLRRRLENPLATELLEDRFSGAQAVRVRAGSTPNDPFLFEPE
ncbi:Chaperone protein ClpB 1 [Synechococcus sp. MIT S9509]|uniref:ATP-dependent Clp protease ATP-binding subunit n=1 Tax=unclassified Synechococcus TaxID=2626047 RepID=UPI0007BB5A1B|nr:MULTISPECIES: AAA family ATPase [unclassified Synechococcus]KZR86085.1 Chaperone protein ClpB 1 [Synechococcus sp. MIT S9504]KZR91660.1 Chaperone protein ClpB 1 [Synechococcus sp. MIT S9509]